MTDRGVALLEVQATMTIERVKLSYDPTKSAGGVSTAMSADGRYIAFSSGSPDVTGASRGVEVYLKDMQTGEIEVISRLPGGGDADTADARPGISDNGRYITYLSLTDRPALGDTDGKADVLVYDRQTRETRIVSELAADGPEAGYSGAISTDGRYIGIIEVHEGGAYKTIAVVDQFTGERVYDTTGGYHFIPLHGFHHVGGDWGAGASPEKTGLMMWSGAAYPVGGGPTSIPAFENGIHYTSRMEYAKFQGPGFKYAMGSDDEFVQYRYEPGVDTNFSITSSTTTNYNGFETYITLPDRRPALPNNQGFPKDSRILNADVSSDGRYVVFVSNFDFNAQNTTSLFHLYVWDTTISSWSESQGVVGQRVSRIDLGIDAAEIRDLQISGNGHYVTLISDAPLTGDDGDDQADLFRIANPVWAGTGGADPSYSTPPTDLTGTPLADNLIGSAAGEEIGGLEGGDFIDGAAGDDVIDGDQGDDYIVGGPGKDEIEGGDGDDTIHGDWDGEEALGDDDVLHGGDGDDTVHGGGGDDILSGDHGADELVGDAGDDSLDGGEGDDDLFGGEGDDILIGGEGADLIVGGEGDDVVEFDGGFDDYAFRDVYDDDWGGYVTLVEDQAGGDIDRVAEVESPLFTSLWTNEVEDHGFDEGDYLIHFALAAQEAYMDNANLDSWRHLSALELGVAIEHESNEGGAATYMNGVYKARFGDLEAVAHVYVGVLDGQNTLMLAFRGQDETGEDGTLPPLSVLYELYEPLVDAVFNYVRYNGYVEAGGGQIDQIMVTGHGAGGSMAQFFMSDDRAVGDRYQAVTFGSPGIADAEPDPRIVQIEHSNDLIPFVGDIARRADQFSIPSELRAVLMRFDDEAVDYRAPNGYRIAYSGDHPEGMGSYTSTAFALAETDALLRGLQLGSPVDNPINLVVGDDEVSQTLVGATTLLPNLLRGAGYFDGSEYFLLAGGFHTVRGGSGRDYFVGEAGDLDGVTFTDFGAGDVLYVLNHSGPIEIEYEANLDPWDGGTLFLGAAQIEIEGFHPGDFLLEVIEGGALAIVYEGLLGIIGGAIADVLAGGTGDDILEGGAGDDVLEGGGGDDALVGGIGSDTLAGGAGDDELWGGDAPSASLTHGLASALASSSLADPAADIDTAVYSGLRGQYRATVSADGVVTITDLRSGAQSEGVDTLHEFEAFAFHDQTYTLEQLLATNPGPGPNPDPDPNPNPNPNPNPDPDPNPNPGQEPLPQTVEAYAAAFQRAALGQAPGAQAKAKVAELVEQVRRGILSQDQALDQMADLHDGTTAVALQTYQFFTGKTPNAAGGLAWLVHSPANDRDLSDSYYAGFNQESRYINFAVNLGVHSSEAQAFAQAYGQMTTGQFIGEVYDKVIGKARALAAGVDLEAAMAYIGRAENISFLRALGEHAGDLDLFVKAALAGQILSIGTTTSFGLYSAAARNYIVDLAMDDLATTNPVDLVGYLAEAG